MNNIDRQYKELLEHILHFGVDKQDRTGTGTKSIFGWQIRHNMKEGFPLLTTKKMAWKTMVTELLWFLKGDTNIKYLVDNGCHIWDGDAYKAYVKYWEPNIEYIDGKAILTQEEFINRIKTDDEFAKTWGKLGSIYGKQWRDWGGKDEVKLTDERDENGYLKFKTEHIDGIDQIANLIEQLKTNPDSRRLMVNAWNVSDLNQMVLPPCHYGFQCYVRDGKYLSLMWNQRSVDTFLGLPFNIASYALLLKMIAKEVDMIPDELIGNLGDCHLYNNHIEQAKEQIIRTPYELPEVIMRKACSLTGEREYTPEDITLINYEYHPAIKAPLSN